MTARRNSSPRTRRRVCETRPGCFRWRRWAGSDQPGRTIRRCATFRGCTFRVTPGRRTGDGAVAAVACDLCRRSYLTAFGVRALLVAAGGLKPQRLSALLVAAGEQEDIRPFFA